MYLHNVNLLEYLYHFTAAIKYSDLHREDIILCSSTVQLPISYFCVSFLEVNMTNMTIQLHIIGEALKNVSANQKQTLKKIFKYIGHFSVIFILFYLQ